MNPPRPEDRRARRAAHALPWVALLSLGALLACGPKHKPVAAKLGMPDVRDGMEALREPVHECYEKHRAPGHAQVTVRIEADGSVSSAEVTGEFAGTPSGRCVEAVVRAARFPSFKEGPIVIQYPLLLR